MYTVRIKQGYDTVTLPMETSTEVKQLMELCLFDDNSIQVIVEHAAEDAE